mmetsp:Transcript_18834/g.30028  ORF Transcript_18834/g.30028 Transcript_18834/m.30028 type:complete len:94 (-) Transcript_18834:645-926(-)
MQPVQSHQRPPWCLKMRLLFLIFLVHKIACSYNFPNEPSKFVETVVSGCTKVAIASSPDFQWYLPEMGRKCRRPISQFPGGCQYGAWTRMALY